MPRFAPTHALVARATALGSIAALSCASGGCAGAPAQHRTAPTHGAASGHRAEPAPTPVARVLLDPGEGDPVAVRVEIARTSSSRQRGLMYRDRMDPDAGMLFLYARAEERTFWMHETRIPLDMIFIGSDRRVIGVVEHAAPGSDEMRGVAGASRYVLEVNAGFARAHGIDAGDVVVFEGDALERADEWSN